MVGEAGGAKPKLEGERGIVTDREASASAVTRGRACSRVAMVLLLLGNGGG